MTGLVRDIHRAYPNQYEIMVDTHWTPVWWNNPHVVKLNRNLTDPRPQLVEIAWGKAITWDGMAEYPNNERKPTHIVAWYHYDLQMKTGLKVPCTEPHGDLHLTPDERRRRIGGRYWVIVAGGKLDLTNKHWWVHRYQEVVNRLRPYGLRFVQVGATHNNNVHPPLENVFNMVGKTDNVRDLFNLILHSEGVICPVTGAMHIAACFNKPCVVLSGGREGPHFEAYVNGLGTFGPDCKPVVVEHQFLHTMGQLDCCKERGCWRKRTVPISPDDLGKDSGKLCRDPIRGKEQSIAACMDKIQTDHVVEAVMSYYEGGILPPIGKPTGKYRQTPIEEPAPDNSHEDLKTAFEKGPSSPMPQPNVSPPPPDIVIPKVKIRHIAPSDDEPRLLRGPSLPPKQQRPSQTVPPSEIDRRGPKKISRKLEILDNPIIGGRMTMFVLCYGPHPGLARRCLDSVLSTVDRDRIDLRVATNEACQDTLNYLDDIKPDHFYPHKSNDLKYPVMRQMFHDPTAPIRTPYAIWFDDDAYVVDPRWLNRLAETIIANHKRGCRLYGIKCYHDLTRYRKNGHKPEQWFREAPWHKGVHFRLRGGERRGPNGSCIDFVPGWFWAIGADAIRMGDIPDVRLGHNGGDITIGCQVTQAGFQIKMFNKDKIFVATPPKEAGGRRVGGYEESFPWVPPTQQFRRKYKPPAAQLKPA